MAEHTSSDTRLHISAAPPLQISKDFHGTDNPIPLSPQWLLPKPGESKTGTGTGENNVISNPSFGNRTDAVKKSGSGEDSHDGNKRKDVFRPSMLDSESRRDRWRDEERETKFSIRKDRWRDGDKDLGDARRVDRWTENLSTRPFGEARRGTTDRWNDSSNRETNFDQRRERENNFDQRRESKWNTRWGPDDKESEGLREKWSDSVKESDMHPDKGLTHMPNHGKDEKEGDHYRPWRPNSTQSRGRGEHHYQQNSTPIKQVSTHSYVRGRGESTPLSFTPGRSRVGSGSNSMNSIPLYSQSPGIILDKDESVHGESFRFSRTKMLDVYQVTDVYKNRKLVDDFVQVPYLTQEEPVEPLALSAPNSEEQAVLDGIDKGEINSSGAPQVQKDGRSSTESTHPRRMKLGGFPFQDRNEDGGSQRVASEVPSSRESTVDGNNFVQPGAEWRAMPHTEHSNTHLHDGRDMPSDIRSRNSDMGWSHHSKDPHNQWESNLGYLSDTKDVSKWQTSTDPIVRKQPSGVLDSEFETRRVMQTSPEELSLFYKDPQGHLQGPFKGIDIIGWFEAGYFGIDLPVRLETAAADTLWSPLGDVMPHLRAKARPPPGFPAPKLNDLTEASGQQNSSGFGNIHAGLSGMQQQSSLSEAENRFLESLMSGSKSSPPLDSLTLSEGLQGFAGNISGNLGSSGVDSGNNLHILAKRMALERQKSLPHPYPYWPGRDAASLVSMSDIVPDPSPPPKLLSSVSDNSHQPQSQSTDLMSIIQGLSERSPVGLNNGVSGWSNYHPGQGGLDSIQHKIDLHRDQNFPQVPFGFQQQRLQAQNQMALTNLLAQAVDNSSGILTAEKLLAPGLSQDPQVLSLLQQQYLLQLHPQVAVPAQQMSLLDKLLLLKQQQKQEEEQQLLLRQQQQLLSQVLQEQSHQHFGESSYGQLQGAAIPIGNFHVDASQRQPLQEMYPMSSQSPLPTVCDELNTKSLNLPPQVEQDTNYNVTIEASAVNLPHQLFGNIDHQTSWTPPVAEQLDDELHQKESLPASTCVESSLVHNDNRSEEEPNIKQKPLSAFDFTTAKSVEQTLDSTCRTDGIVTAVTTESNDHCVTPIVSSAASCAFDLPQASDLKVKTDFAHEELEFGEGNLNVEPSVAEVITVEAREPKKASEKKSRKQKSSKSQSSDHAKGVQKTPHLLQTMQSEAEKPNASDLKLGKANKGENHEGYSQQTRDKGNQSGKATVDVADPQEIKDLQATVTARVSESDVIQGDLKAVDSVATHNEMHVGQRAWKPAPGFKPKSLLEIQQEEQRRAQTLQVVSEITSSVSTMNVTTPWAGVVANPDSLKISNESHREVGSTEYVIKPESVQNPKSKKSPLHDLLAEEVLKKSSERDADDSVFISSNQNVGAYTESVDDDNFIEAKDSKRSRKKSTKSKGSGAKAPVPPASSELPVGSSLNEKGKSSRSVQPEKDILPAIPVGPSLGDFVPWKEESVSPSPSPAWSTDSGWMPKPTSLRDILKEQEKKASSAVPTNHLPTQQISQPAQANRSSGPSWSISGSSPSKAASPIQINSRASAQSKYKGDDDLFWGPIEQSKQETKQSEFPQLSGQGSLGSKNVPVKGNSPGPLTRQKSVSGKLTERSPSSLPASSQSLLKSKKDAMTKHSEAKGFRDWCENECVRLIGTRDTSFLEYCLKQSRSEAEMLLIENLGSYDPDHEFIDKFLNYKELLPSDVLEIAFQGRSDPKAPGFSAGHVNSGNADGQDMDHTGLEGSTKGGGKRKGKKGKKVSPSVLGFNVVSNRIMMGEIQAVED